MFEPPPIENYDTFSSEESSPIDRAKSMAILPGWELEEEKVCQVPNGFRMGLEFTRTGTLKSHKSRQAGTILLLP